MTIDLSEMSLEELQQLRKEIDKAEKAMLQRKRKEALAAVENAARDFGFSLSELTGATAPSPAKYRNPEDPDQTWTGRGRKPKWVIAHLEAGKPMEDLEA